MDWTDVVGAVCAVLSMCGAGFAWWRANLSKQARREAEEARAASERARADAEERLATVRRLASEIEAQTAEMRRSNDAAEARLAEARRLAESASLQASELGRMARSLEGPLFSLEPYSDSKNNALWTLGSRSDVPLTVTEIVNRDKILGFSLKTPFTLDPGGVVEFRAIGSWERPIPATLVLRVEGNDEPVHVKFRR